MCPLPCQPRSHAWRSLAAALKEWCLKVRQFLSGIFSCPPPPHTTTTTTTTYHHHYHHYLASRQQPTHSPRMDPHNLPHNASFQAHTFV